MLDYSSPLISNPRKTALHGASNASTSEIWKFGFQNGFNYVRSWRARLQGHLEEEREIGEAGERQ